MFVRWDNLTTEADEAARLPGYREPAVVRRFDAPEALNVRFYEVRAKSALNRVPEQSRMPFRFTVNPYRGCTHACVYCFARPTHEYLGLDAGRDFEREIVVKVNVPEVLRVELARPSWSGEHIAMGTNTDPYQWVESRYRLMPGIWEALRDARNPCSVLTKSPLLLRDLDLLREIAAVTEIQANLSVPTLDERAWRASEPHTPHPRKRIEAVAELNRAGIPTGVLVAPLMPGINDDPRQVARILELAGEAGATGVGGIALHLRGAVRGVFMDWLRTYRPDLVDRYEELYARSAYATPSERSRLSALLRRPGVEPPVRLRPAGERLIPRPADGASARGPGRRNRRRCSDLLESAISQIDGPRDSRRDVLALVASRVRRRHGFAGDDRVVDDALQRTTSPPAGAPGPRRSALTTTCTACSASVTLMFRRCPRATRGRAYVPPRAGRPRSPTCTITAQPQRFSGEVPADRGALTLRSG